VKKQKVETSTINLLELIPDRNIQSEKTGEGLTILLKQKFHHPWFIKHILPRLKNPHYKIKLDDVGSFIWELCDGEKSIKEISARLKEKFGDKVEPLYDRLGIFFQNLEKNNFIKFKNL
jgi:hypothetical protein